MPDSRVIVGDCLEVMRGMDAGSCQCCVTSPPYWGLRDYGVKGQLGLEPTPEIYLEKMVEVFREVRRLLRDDGVMLLNCGDSYNSDASNQQYGRGMRGGECGMGRHKKAVRPPGLKPKDLCMMPSRLALALQADRWWVRSKLPWLKRSAMPESCTDRPTSAIEYVFLLTKSARYFYDAEAVRTKESPQTLQKNPRYKRGPDTTHKRHVNGVKSFPDTHMHVGGRNFRNSDLFYESLKAPHGMICVGDEPVALDVNPERFIQAHFATFPRKLVTPLLKAATSEKGCCPECGAPWRRLTEETKLRRERPNDRTSRHEAGPGVNSCGNTVAGVSTTTTGWEPGCGCMEPIQYENGEYSRDLTVPMPISCTVLDPFAGSGTVGVVAKQLGLSFIGIELNPDYAAMARKRIANPEPMPDVVDVEGQMDLFEED